MTKFKEHVCKEPYKRTRHRMRRDFPVRLTQNNSQQEKADSKNNPHGLLPADLQIRTEPSRRSSNSESERKTRKEGTCQCCKGG